MKDKNVLSLLPDGMFLSQINLFGTHDSMTAYVDFENVARCQFLTMEQQLSLGVRLFDIRLSKRAGEFYLVHSFANCYKDQGKKERMNFDFVLSRCEKFLEENPKETVILSVKQDRGLQFKGFFSAFYRKYISGHEDKWYLKNENPTLCQCRGKIVLMRRCKWRKKYKEKGGLDFSFWKDQGKKKYDSLPVILSEKQKAVVQDRYCLEAEEKWRKCAKPALEVADTDENNFAVHFLSTSTRINKQGLDKTAEIVNARFKEYPLKKGTGWLLFDFPDEEIAEKVIKSNLKEH